MHPNKFNTIESAESYFSRVLLLYIADTQGTGNIKFFEYNGSLTEQGQKNRIHIESSVKLRKL